MATFKSYDEILDSIKKKVQESLSSKDNTKLCQNDDSDTGTDDDLEWEFTVQNCLMLGKCRCIRGRITRVSYRFANR